MKNVKNRSKSHKKWPFFAIILSWMARYWSETSFLLIFSAKDDLVKVSWKSDARKCQNQVTLLNLTSWVKDASPFVISQKCFIRHILFFTLFLMSDYTDGRIIIWMFQALHSKRLRTREPSTRGWSWPWRTSTQVTCSTPSHSTSLIFTLSHFCHSQSPSLTHRQSRTSSQATPLLVTHTLTWILIHSHFIVESCEFELNWILGPVVCNDWVWKNQ